jgi:hypothetical protein
MHRTAAISAGATYFAIVFAAGFVFGTVRTVLIAPRFGELLAVVLELPIMLGISWWACGWTLQRFRLPPESAPRMAMGAVAFTFLIIAEILISFALGRSIAEYGSDLATSHGLLGLAGQLAFGLFPLLRRNG